MHSLWIYGEALLSALAPFALCVLAHYIYTLFFNKPRSSAKKTTSAFPLPEPPQRHASLTDFDPSRGVLVVGDVHGCLDELKQLLTLHRGGDDVPVVFVGDLVNKGPKSAECVAFIRALPRAYSVRGNHDDEALRAVLSAASPSASALPARYSWTRSLRPADTAWLAALPYSLSLPALDVVVVHAGLGPETPLLLHRQQPKVLTTIRGWAAGYGGDCGAWGQGAAGGDAEDADESDAAAGGVGGTGVGGGTAGKEKGKEKEKEKEGPARKAFVVFGHDAKAGLQQHTFALGLDTGCVYGRALSAVRVFREGRGGGEVRREVVSVEALDCYAKCGGGKHG